MRNHFCPESCHCENYDACRCDGCGNNDIYKGEKKKISSIMRSALKKMIIEYATARKIEVRFEPHWRSDVDAEYVHFWDGEYHNKMEICWDEVANIYMTFEPIVSECDRWLKSRVSSLYPKVYITTARGGGKSAFSEMWHRWLVANADAVAPVRRINLPAINKVIFNDPATIIMWADGTKTVVKADKDVFDPEKGMAMAICKKVLGNQGNYYETFKKWLPKEDKLEKFYEEAKKQSGYKAEGTEAAGLSGRFEADRSAIKFAKAMLERAERALVEKHFENHKEDK